MQVPRQHKNGKVSEGWMSVIKVKDNEVQEILREGRNPDRTPSTRVLRQAEYPLEEEGRSGTQAGTQENPPRAVLNTVPEEDERG